MQSLQPRYCTILGTGDCSISGQGSSGKSARGRLRDEDMDNPSLREACVGLPSRPTWAESRERGEQRAMPAAIG